MPTLSEACAALAEATGVPRGTIEHVGRRLGEAALLPRGPRGVNAPQLDAHHLAMLAIGLLHIGDGFAGTIARVPVEVAKVAALARAEHGAGFELSRHVLIEGDFLTSVAQILAGMSDPDPEARRDWRAAVDGVGLVFGGGHAAGFIVLSAKATGTDTGIGFTYSASPGEGTKVWHAPFRRQIRLDGSALVALGGLLMAGDGEEEDGGDRTTARATPPPPARTEQQQQEHTACQRQN